MASVQDPVQLLEQYNALTLTELKLGKDNVLQATHSRPDLTNEYVAPRDELEQEIAEIWQQLLGIERIGIFDGYLDLGGDSLLATQLIAKIRESFDVALPFAVFFDNTTIADISASVLSKQLEELELDEIEKMISNVEA